MNTIMLPEKLGKVLAQLETESDGVRLAAVSAATRILQEHGLRWCQVSVTAGAVTREQERPRTDRTDPFAGRSWRIIAVRCGNFPQHLDAWELEFIRGLQRFPRLSPKQYSKLSTIVSRLRARGCRV